MLERCIDSLIGAAQLQKNVEMNGILGAFLLDNNLIQNRRHQRRIDFPGEAQRLVQRLPDGRDVQFLRRLIFFLPDGRQFSMALQNPDVEGIVALLEFFYRQCTGNAQIQQPIFLSLQIIHLIFHLTAELAIIHFFGNVGQHRHQRIDNFLLIPNQLLENVAEDKIQVTAANLWCRAGRPSVAAVNLALPDLLLPLFCLDHLTVKGCSVFLAVDFRAVGITVVKAEAAAV